MEYFAGNNVADAFGWDVAKTKEDADAIATTECLKRSNVRAASNMVWACNAVKAPLKIIRNDIASFKPALKTYAVDENGTGYLKLGNKTILSTTAYRFKKELVPGELFLFCLRDPDDYYKYINPFCIIDKNGVQKSFGGEKYFEEIETYLPYNINQNEKKDFKWGLVSVKDFYRKDDSFGSSFHGDDQAEIETAMVRWGDFPEEKLKYPNNFSNIYHDKLTLADSNFDEKETRAGFYCFQRNRNSVQRTNFKTEFNEKPIK